VPAGEDSVLLGDFNFKTSSAQYRRTVEVLDDAWFERWPSGTDGEGRDKTDRIDHVFLSSELSVMDARYIDDPAADHPVLVVDVSR
jgi:endonuclease/exonuclease/phosphatase family metal-dependent hydrolase